MQLEFRNKYLVELYEKGKCRKYRLQPNITTKFFMRIQQLKAAGDIYDLWKTASLNLEKMEGYDNRYSIRVQDKWRLEMEIEWENEEKTTGTIFIVELSKHYR